ncbi:MAG: Flp pilus assembly complex ATPase component TadA [Nitrosarchaeum sp.]|nr:Flp pilus assembly complex ATPase component TadA [Nitrosarchaeum sp.]
MLRELLPPNQRIISIEDTRELQLPKFLHWVPMNTRLPNAEGKGEVSMGHLLVNSLRMRPDRILVGEVRRAREAETLFEAIHTGHSVYATFHANNSEEAVKRLTNAPIDVPKIMLPAISLIIVQFRNRRTGLRRTFQIAEVTEEGEANVIMQYDTKKDQQVKHNKSTTFYDTLRLYTGYTDKEIDDELAEKQEVLRYLVEQGIQSVDEVGKVIAEYYTNKANLMKFVKMNKRFA